MSEQEKMDQERAAFVEWYGTPKAFEAGDKNGWSGTAWEAWKKRASLPVGVPDGWKMVGHQFQGRDGEWNQFMDQRHYENTKADGTWPIREIYTPAALPASEQSPTDKQSLTVAEQSAPERVSVLCEALEDARRAMFAVLNQEPRMKAVAKRVLNAEIERIDRALLASHGRGEA